MPAGRVAHHHDPIEVERVLHRERAHSVHRLHHVDERAGPLASGIAEAAVLDVPARDPVSRKVGAQMAGVRQVVDRLPIATMDIDDQRKPALTSREPQVAELERLDAVGDARVRRLGRRLPEDLDARPRHKLILR